MSYPLSVSSGALAKGVACSDLDKYSYQVEYKGHTYQFSLRASSVKTEELNIALFFEGKTIYSSIEEIERAQTSVSEQPLLKGSKDSPRKVELLQKQSLQASEFYGNTVHNLNLVAKSICNAIPQKILVNF